MKCLQGATIILAVLIIAATVFAASGRYSVAADEPHWGATAGLLAFVRQNAVASRASLVVVPADLKSDKRIARGAVSYAEMCADCHLAPGLGNTELREGLYPVPPDLVHNPPANDPKSAFWVIKHGLKMTGMAAWGKTHSDDLIWNMVAFLPQLPTMTPERYRALTARARPGEHGHDDDHAH